MSKFICKEAKTCKRKLPRGQGHCEPHSHNYLCDKVLGNGMVIICPACVEVKEKQKPPSP